MECLPDIVLVLCKTLLGQDGKQKKEDEKEQARSADTPIQGRATHFQRSKAR